MINENKKGVRAVKHTVKTKNPVAKAHQTVGSGSGEHKDKKRSAELVRGQKHKNKELAEFAALAPMLSRAVAGGVARTASNAFANDDQNENVDDAEYNDEAGMANNNLKTLHRAVVGLDEIINDGDNLPEWCQEKIAVAKSMLVTVWDYMQSEEDSLAEGLPKDPNAPKKVQDRKTGKWYDPKKEFDKKMNSPEVMAQMKRMAQKEGVAGPKQCWPGHRKVGTQPGTGKNKGKRVNDCEKISESNWYELRLQTLLNENLKK